jgi:hypothetical protein
MILEGFAQYDPVSVIPAVGKGLLTGSTLVLYCFERTKDCFGHCESPIVEEKSKIVPVHCPAEYCPFHRRMSLE